MSPYVHYIVNHKFTFQSVDYLWAISSTELLTCIGLCIQSTYISSVPSFEIQTDIFMSLESI